MTGKGHFYGDIRIFKSGWTLVEIFFFPLPLPLDLLQRKGIHSIRTYSILTIANVWEQVSTIRNKIQLFFLLVHILLLFFIVIHRTFWMPTQTANYKETCPLTVQATMDQEIGQTRKLQQTRLNSCGIEARLFVATSISKTGTVKSPVFPSK